MYKAIRNVHLLLASFSLPFLLMYAISAVQMAHNTWFAMKPAVREQQFSLTAGGPTRAKLRATCSTARRPQFAAS
jgi:hypothetical protein